MEGLLWSTSTDDIPHIPPALSLEQNTQLCPLHAQNKVYLLRFSPRYLCFHSRAADVPYLSHLSPVASVARAPALWVSGADCACARPQHAHSNSDSGCARFYPLKTTFIGWNHPLKHSNKQTMSALKRMNGFSIQKLFYIVSYYCFILLLLVYFFLCDILFTIFCVLSLYCNALWVALKAQNKTLASL